MKENILSKISRNIFSYQQLMEALCSYKKPRDKISRMLESKEIIKVKKGLYVLGKAYRKKLIEKKILANLLWGPSYISLEYALSYYNLIPEKVEVVTSICCKRKKEYKTPFGYFIYYPLTLKKYSIGILLKDIEDTSFLIASQEKALSDLIARQHVFNNSEEVNKYLLVNLRIEKDALQNFNVKKMKEISTVYQNKNVYLLYLCIMELKL